MGTKVRILAAIKLDGADYKPNQVVDFPAPIAKALAAAGQVDPHKDAVAYCVNELHENVVVHQLPPEPESEPTAPPAPGGENDPPAP